jgi:CHRD domain
VAGGVMVFFCSNVGGPAGVQACPAGSGTVTGTLTAANVIGPAAQNVTAGDFQALVDALESDTAYANIHTKNFGGGEIRGQIHRDFGFDHDD